MSARLRLLGPAGPVLLWVALACAGALTPGYSHATQAVSELGAVGAPVPWLINWVGIVPFAVSLAVTGVFVVRDLRPGPAAWLSGGLLVASGLGFAVAGAMRCDVGCGPSELQSAVLHGIGAGVGFQLAPLAALVLGSRAFRRSPHRPVYAFSALMAVVMVASIALFLGVFDPGRSLGGVWQRLVLLAISVWVVGLSVSLYRSASTGGSA
ncbi:DUF998 domain-containing protein [Rubrivirga sp. IMCC43871]|uniref:DUF998 domain-containing protein n=1 Tax=Rubrivirga sp. IMCC43871 TaxID=3391575 RepID=UPI00398F9B49